MAERAVKAGLLLAFLAVVADIFAIALPWWSYREEEIFGELWRSNHGLWEECNRITDMFGHTQNTCLKAHEPKGHVVNARNTCILGLFLVLCSILTTYVGRWVTADLKLVPLVGALLMMIAGFVIWLGVLLYSAGHVTIAGNEPWDVHAGWYLALISGCLCFLATVLCLWDKMGADNTGKSREDEITPGIESQGAVTPSSSDNEIAARISPSLFVGIFSRDEPPRERRMSTPIQSISPFEARGVND